MSPGYRDVLTERLGAVRIAIDRRRPVAIGVTMVLSIGLLAASGYPRWRVAVASTMVAASLVSQRIRMARVRRRNEPGRVTLAGIVGNTLMLGAIVAVTGGLAGPLLPILFPRAISAAIGFGWSLRSVVGFAAATLVLVVLAVVHPQLAGPPIVPWVHATAVLVTTVGMLLVSYMQILAMTEAYVAAGDQIESMREELLAHADERARTLQSIGAKVAHELKNPLAAIKGLVQLVSSAPIDPRSRERLAVALDEVGRMEVILRDYLSYSRPLEDLRTHEVELCRLADEALLVLEGRASAGRVRLARVGSAVSITADARRLKEALMNLLANAIEATPPGGVVEVRVRADGDGGAEIEIRDTGRGVAPDLLARMGTPFLSDRETGTGLGVVLARATVQQHGGELTYASRVGHGTTVRIRLPGAPPPAV